ncbi:unnamed protein product [Protopolystoma xenopodis]|uniref:Uncharacterized protein n=1 Tax=Protopolystoma xenopodis TaxID=117903 RepID=A0A3S5FF59_9PLAT|nr:unnamed protein product [Protopolystoma xenopodis]
MAARLDVRWSEREDQLKAAMQAAEFQAAVDELAEWLAEKQKALKSLQGQPMRLRQQEMTPTEIKLNDPDSAKSKKASLGSTANRVQRLKAIEAEVASNAPVG